MNFLNFFENKLLLEMAKQGDRPRGAIKLDDDDIEFLYQFPPQYWTQAIYQRYNHDLFNALKNREGQRRKKQEAMISMLKSALKKGNFKELKSSDLFSKDQIISIRKNYGKNTKWREEWKDDEEAIENAAENIAYYAVEKLVPDATDKESETYSFNKGKRTDKVVAKSFTNRLIHKLERTVGEKHSMSSGLDTNKVGLYGFDLANPIKSAHKVEGKDQHQTDGLIFPTIHSARESIEKLLGMNFHRYFGEMPENNSTQEIPDSSSPTRKSNVAIHSWGRIPHNRQDYFKDSVLKDDYVRGREKYYDEVMPWFLFDKPQLESIYGKLKRSGYPIGAESITKIASSPEFTEQEKSFFATDRQALNHLVLYKDLAEGIKRPDDTNFKKVVGQNVIIWEDFITKKKFPNSVKNQSERKTLITNFCKADFEYYKKSNPDVKGPPIPNIAPEGMSISDDQHVHLPLFKKKINLNGENVEIDMPFLKGSKYFRYANQKDPVENRHGYQKNIVHLAHHAYRKESSNGHMSGASIHPNQNTPRVTETIKKGIPDYTEKYNRVFGEMEKDNDGLYVDIVKGIEDALKLTHNNRLVNTDYLRIILSNNIQEIHNIIVKKLESLLSNNEMSSKDKRRLLAFNTTKSIMQQNTWGSGSVRKRVFKIRKKRKIPTNLISPQQIAHAKKITVENLAELGRRRFSAGHAFPFNMENIRHIIDEIKAKAQQEEEKHPLYHVQYGLESKKIVNFLITKFRTKKMLLDAMTGLLKLIIYNTGVYGEDLENKTNDLLKPIVGNKKKTMPNIVSDFQSLQIVQNALGGIRQPVDANMPLQATKTFSPVEFKTKNKRSKSKIISMGKFARDPQKLLNKGKYLELSHNGLFMIHNNKQTLLNLRKWVVSQKEKGLIKQKDYDDSIKSIDHYISTK